MLRIAHTGDLHPNARTTFAGKMPVDPLTGKNLALTDLRKSLDFLYQTITANETQCDALIVPGDVFDSVAPTMDEVQIMVQFFERVATEMPVVITPGNHDMGASGNMATALQPLTLRRNVYILEDPRSILLEIGGQPVRFYGLPYPTKGALLANQAYHDKRPEEVTAIINDCLAAIVRGFRLEFTPGILNVLLAHGSVTGCKVGVQPRTLAHDILIPLEELVGFDYVGLNHIHNRQQAAPNAYYSGNLCRQDFGEEHEPKGFHLVEIGPGQPLKVHFVLNPHARVYQTLSRAHLPAVLAPEIVWRFKDTMTPEEYEALKPELLRLQARTPYFQIDVDFIETERTRDAEMAKCPTMEQALERALQTRIVEGTLNESQIPALLQKHRALAEEVCS